MYDLNRFLPQYKALLVEIEDKGKRLNKLRSCISRIPQNMKNKVSDEIQGAINLEKSLNKSIDSCLDMLAKIEDFIRGIPDSRDRVILFNRYIKGQTWFQIANCLGFSSESTPRKRFTRIKKRLNLA